MKKILISTLLSIACYADLQSISSIEADFSQTIVDDHNKTLVYKGHLFASKPQYALWQYTQPVKKEIYLYNDRVTIIEPELEQAIIKHLQNQLNFFTLIKQAKQIDKHHYVTFMKDKKIFITLNKDKIESIHYKDEFENDVTLIFTNEIINKAIPQNIFEAKIPIDFDIITE
jgi:outer membrane lipoprotein carrier protein